MLIKAFKAAGKNLGNFGRKMAGDGAAVRAESHAAAATSKIKGISEATTAQADAIRSLGLDTAAEQELLKGIGEANKASFSAIGERAAEDILGGGGIKGTIRRNPITSGAVALGSVAYGTHVLGKAGTPVASEYASPEEGGAQRAMMEFAGMQAGYGAPMPQIEAANANHMGMVQGAQLARG